MFFPFSSFILHPSSLAVALPFGQTAHTQDLFVIGLLVILEGVLSIDNALVLGLLAKNLPGPLQKKALTYGLVGAFAFRIVAIGMATLLMKWWVVKALGGGYLVYVAVKHLFFDKKPTEAVTIGRDGHPVIAGSHAAHKIDKEHMKQFWSAVIAIELTDIAFAVDSILAAIALVANTSKTWVVVVGGMLGVILMRFAAIIFIKLLEKFPRFELAAYLLVLAIGLKLLVDWYFNRRPADLPASEYFEAPVNFHSPDSIAFWIFWITMLVCFSVGFLPARKPRTAGSGG